MMDNSVFIVTGGTSGIGLACVKTIIQRGGQVITCARKPFDFGDLFDINDLSRLHFQQMDISQKGIGQRLIDTAIDRFGQINVLINNAAQAPMKSLGELTDQDFSTTVNTNMRSIFELTRAVFPHFISNGDGVIVNLSSMAAVDPFAGFSLYGASKAWIETFTQATASEGRQYNIACYSIRAGTVETPLLRKVLPDYPRDQTLHPEDVAKLICQLAQSGDRSQSGTAIEIHSPSGNKSDPAFPSD
ncbi:SDR family oxidoreductase [Mariniblastus sp.]|jgi:NAD(P)-dependent dehydrogenase (short-subunit alcohol dehydrogenase family)|nr:SDR family oxidoreductase [Mariniblastus sp.]MDB4755836.1 SDR family oxidoreductase [Mariniblastus sp.]